MTSRAIARSCLICVAMLGADPASVARANSILAGSDYFTTLSASFNFGGAIGVLPLTGRFGPGVTDTVVTRLENAILPAVGSSDTIDIQMRLLALMSVAPVNIGGSFFDVFVSLDPSAPSTGTMTIVHDFPDNATPAAEGTFTANMTVNFIAEFAPVGGGSSMFVNRSLGLSTATPALWSHEPPPGIFLAFGLPPNLDANCHVLAGPPCSPLDFFPGLVLELHAGDLGRHEAAPALQNCNAADPNCRLAPPIPEPGTSVLLLSGLSLLIAKRRRLLSGRR